MSNKPIASEPSPIEGTRILVVDDHNEVLKLIDRSLVGRGAESSIASSAEEALRFLDPGGLSVDLVLLDIEMPGRSGWDVLEHIRASGAETPVIFLTATADIDSRVRGLERGADDFVVKPFHERELLARIEAVLRRRQAPAFLHHGHVRLDPSRRSAHVSGREVELTPREFDLLRVLTEARGRTVSRTELLDKVWNMQFEPGTTVVEVQVARLRRKVDVVGPPIIENVIGEGYRLRQLRG
jgi:DNA-binding response OmpR family regulator